MSERPEVSLRPFEPGDAAAVHRWFNNPEATKTLMEQRESFSLEEAEAWVGRAMDDAGEDRKYAIVVEGHEEPVGFTALYGLFRQTAPELGALIGDEVRGSGVGRRAEALTIAKAFDEFGAHRVYGRIPALNEAAKRTVTSLGWQHEGTMRAPPAPRRRAAPTTARSGACSRTSSAPPPRTCFRERPARAAELIADRGEAAAGDEFFRSRPFLDAEGVTHTLRIEAARPASCWRRWSSARSTAAPSSTRPPPTATRASRPELDHPGGATSDASIPAAIDFVRDRPGHASSSATRSATPPLAGASERNVVQIADPALPPKSRPSDRNQINRTAATATSVELVPGAETAPEQRAGFLAAYEQTMRRTGAAERYFFGAAYFDRILESPTAPGSPSPIAPTGGRRRLDRRAQRRLPPLLPQRQRRLAPARLADEERRRGAGRALRRAGPAAQPRRRHHPRRPRSRSSSAASPTASMPWRTSELVCDPRGLRPTSAAAATAAASSRPTGAER